MSNYRKFGSLASVCPNLAAFYALPCRQMLPQNNTGNLLRLRELQSNRIGFLSVGSLPIGICHTVHSLCDGMLRIERGEIWADERKVAEFTVVGHKRICRFAPVDVLTLTIKITASRTEPTLRLLAVYQ